MGGRPECCGSDQGTSGFEVAGQKRDGVGVEPTDQETVGNTAEDAADHAIDWDTVGTTATHTIDPGGGR